MTGSLNHGLVFATLQHLLASGGVGQNQALHDHMQSLSTTNPDANGAELVLLSVTDIIGRYLITEGLAPGEVIPADAALPVTAPHVGYLVHRRAALGTAPAVSVKDELLAWDGSAFVTPTPALFYAGLSAGTSAESTYPCEDVIVGSYTAPVPVVWDETMDMASAGVWVLGTDGLIRKPAVDTAIDPHAVTNPGHAAVYGTVAYTETEFAALATGAYCSFFAALAALAGESDLPRGEFGGYDPNVFYDAIVHMLGDINSDASIETFDPSAGGTVPTLLPESGANDNYVQGNFYLSAADGLIYERIGVTGGVDPNATGNPDYATLWAATGMDQAAWDAMYGTAGGHALRINIQQVTPDYLSGAGNESDPQTLNHAKVVEDAAGDGTAYNATTKKLDAALVHEAESGSGAVSSGAGTLTDGIKVTANIQHQDIGPTAGVTSGAGSSASKFTVAFGTEAQVGTNRFATEAEANDLAAADLKLSPVQLKSTLQRNLNVKVIDGPVPAATGADGSPDGQLPIYLYRQPDGSILDAAGEVIKEAPGAAAGLVPGTVVFTGSQTVCWNPTQSGIYLCEWSSGLKSIAYLNTYGAGKDCFAPGEIDNSSGGSGSSVTGAFAMSVGQGVSGTFVTPLVKVTYLG